MDINTGSFLNNSAAYTPPVKAAVNGNVGTENVTATIERKPESIFGDIKQQKAEEKDISQEEIEETTGSLNKIMQLMNADLQFVLHEKTQRFMVQLVDVKEHKVLKEFPPHELLDTIAAIKDYVGILLDEKA